LNRFPDNVKLQLLLPGLLAQTEGGRNEAIGRYRAILAVDPENRLGQTGLAEAYRLAGRNYEALEAFGKLEEQVPGDARYAVRVGQVYGALGELDEARRHFERAHGIDASNVDAVRSLALLADVDDRPEIAADYYKKLALLYPGDASAQLALRAAQDRI